MPRQPRQDSRRNNPDFSPVTALIAKELGKRLRLFVMHQETTISEVVEKAIEDYLNKHQLQQTVEQPKTIAEFIQQNYWRLQQAKIKNIDALARGQKPEQADLVRICSVLNQDFEALQSLAEHSFPENSNVKSEEKDLNGCTGHHS